MDNNQRRQYLINKELQGKYIFCFVTMIVMGALLFILFFCMTTAETWMVIYSNHNATPGSTPFLLIKEILKANWLLVSLAGVMVSILAVMYSHKIAGPLHKFTMVLEDMRNGILDPNCSLRHKDDGQEVMEQLQQTNRFFVEQINELRSIAENLETAEAGDGETRETIAGEIRRLKAIVGGFTVKQ